MRKLLLSLNLALFTALAASSLSAGAANASEIKYIVNKTAITTLDIQHRAAFLKLQHKKGNLTKMAGDEMVDQALRLAEVSRLGIKTSPAQVDAAFERFAKSNKMTPKQMAGVLNQTGVTDRHFKDYIATQMGWNQALSKRYQSQGGAVSEQDAVRRMLENGGTKPTATEYMLQQVIFVVPAKERAALMAKRKREADSMRQRFSSCDTTRSFAKGLIDVTVRDLGRVLAPELPPDWAEQIKKAKIGSATPTRDTDRGVEFIGICSSREVSDDRTAKTVFNAEGSQDQQADALNVKYIKELRDRARIVEK